MEKNIPNYLLLRELMNALYHDDFTSVQELLQKRPTLVNLPYNHNGWTPFLWVCKEHCAPDIIQMFLKNARINKPTQSGATPLHIMARYRSSFDCLALLIDNGADVNAQDNNGNTPLHIAVKHPQTMMRKNVIRGLVEYTDTGIKNNEGKTAYDIAKENAAFDDEDLLLLLKPVDDLTEDEFVKALFVSLGEHHE